MNVIKEKSYKFSLRMINAYKYLTNEQREFILSKQLLRSGTAIGALVREAEYAESKSDFVHKLRIALKEANETEYWLQLLRDTEFIDNKSFDSISSDCTELLKLLTAIIKSSVKNN